MISQLPKPLFLEQEFFTIALAITYGQPRESHVCISSLNAGASFSAGLY
jgi:hypothetical protein